MGVLYLALSQQIAVSLGHQASLAEGVHIAHPVDCVAKRRLLAIREPFVQQIQPAFPIADHLDLDIACKGEKREEIGVRPQSFEGFLEGKTPDVLSSIIYFSLFTSSSSST
jgi:hypothetical protein